MKPETQEWLGNAKSDYDSCLYLLKGARYPQALYFMCQALEKALKAAQVELKSQQPKKNHLLGDLAQASGLDIPNSQVEFLEDLTKDYNRVRYADYAKYRGH